jgi:hypothetical protein
MLRGDSAAELLAVPSHWHSKSFSAGTENAPISCCRNICIAMPEALILD